MLHCLVIQYIYKSLVIFMHSVAVNICNTVITGSNKSVNGIEDTQQTPQHSMKSTLKWKACVICTEEINYTGSRIPYDLFQCTQYYWRKLSSKKQLHYIELMRLLFAQETNKSHLFNIQNS